MNPQVIGAEKVALEIMDNVIKPEKFEIKLPEVKAKTSPCGSSCENCPMRLENHCNACPATIYYKEND